MNSLTQKDITSGLRKFGIESGMDLEVHNSLKNFSHVEGGAKTVLATLKDTTAVFLCRD